MFGRKKKESLKEVPSYSDEGMLVYVLRNKPEKWGKIKISGSIKGSGFKDIHSPLEVEPLTADFAGGGEYTAKFFRPGGVDYLGQYKFEIAGLPKINGEVLAEPTDDKKPTGDPLDREVVQIKKEMNVAAAKAEQAKQRKNLLSEAEDDDDDDGVEEIDTEKEAMREENEKLKKDLEETLKRESREKEERRDRDQREREDRRDREYQEGMKQLRSEIASMGTQRDSGGTMEAIKTMIAAQADATKAMLATMDNNRKESAERSSETTKMLIAQSNRMADVQIAAAKETADVKTNQSEHILSVMENTWKTALAVGSGRAPSEGPKDLPGVIGDVTSRICDVVTEFIREKGKQAISPEKLAEMIRKTGKQAANDIRAPQRLRALPPVTSPPAVNPVDPRTAMNRVLRVFIDEMKSGVKEPTWGSVAEKELPTPILTELITAAQDGDMEQLVGVVRKYADPNMADEVTELLAQASQEEVEPEIPDEASEDPFRLAPEEPPEVTPEEAPKEPPKEAPKEPSKEQKPPKPPTKKPAKAPSKKKR